MKINKDFTNVLTKAVRKKYPDSTVDQIRRAENLGYTFLKGMLENDEVPSNPVTIRKIANAFNIDFDELYLAHFRQVNPDTLKWLESFDVNRCDFADLVRYSRIKNGWSRDEFDARLKLTNRGCSIRYEQRTRMPLPNNIPNIADGLGVDERIVLYSIARQTAGTECTHRYGKPHHEELTNRKPYIIKGRVNLGEALRNRIEELDMSYVALARDVGISTDCLRDRDNLKTIHIPSLCKVAAYLNIDIFSMIDKYYSEVSFEYLNTNFGTMMFIVCICLGIPMTGVSTDILQISSSSLWNYMIGLTEPRDNVAASIAVTLGMDVDVLTNMFSSQCNYEYAKLVGFDVVKYIISSKWRTLKNLNVHVVKQLFAE